MNRKQLAGVMIKGLRTKQVTESQTTYIALRSQNHEKICYACALGCALIGHYDGDFKQALSAWSEATRHRGEYDAFADLLEISPALAVEIEHKHINGWTVETIAAWLKFSDDQEAKSV